MYGFNALKKELENIDELKFIFTDPTFIKSVNTNKEQREFQINVNNREKSVFGNEFEIKLRNF